MDPFDIVLSIVPTLPEPQKQKLREMLGLGIIPACMKNGHKFKVMGQQKGGWFVKGFTRLFCEKCSSVVIVEE